MRNKANMERGTRPPAAMIAPRIVTVRQPYLFTKLLAMGPEKQGRFKPTVMVIRKYKYSVRHCFSVLNLFVLSILLGHYAVVQEFQ